MNVAYLQLSSTGDICSLLPIAKHRADAGDKVYIITQRQYGVILEAVSYVTPILVDVEVRYLFFVEADAKNGRYGVQFDEVIACQTFANTRRTAYGCSNWQTMQWYRCGMLDKFHELPLVFDRRDDVTEASIMLDAGSYGELPDKAAPLLAYNLRGKSTPYRRADEMRAWIEASFPRWRLLDLGALTLDKPQHLLPLIEVADCLISIDTLTLHLAYATCTPTIAITNDAAFGGSEPRSHWVYQVPYADSLKPESLAEMKRIIDARDFAPGRLCRKPSEMTRRYVWHAASVAWHQHDDGKYAWRDDDERARWLDVHASWLAIRAEDYFFQSVLTNHDAGHEPSVREVIDRAAEQAEPQDAIIWTGPFAKLPENALELARAVEGCTLISERVWAMTVAWWRQFGKYAICIGDELFACDGRWELSRERGPQFVPIEPVLAI